MKPIDSIASDGGFSLLGPSDYRMKLPWYILSGLHKQIRSHQQIMRWAGWWTHENWTKILTQQLPILISFVSVWNHDCTWLSNENKLDVVSIRTWRLAGRESRAISVIASDLQPHSCKNWWDPYHFAAIEVKYKVANDNVHTPDSKQASSIRRWLIKRKRLGSCNACTKTTKLS